MANNSTRRQRFAFAGCFLVIKIKGDKIFGIKFLLLRKNQQILAQFHEKYGIFEV
ncbi:hypothetical protein [Bacillus oleivorans]|uniref:hypothetical protein n=1 Tax=Bacillus oleivorans TaxID=1448271 RepID=UPI0015CAD53F|nr:hypothetical protein [Bacillus oleivorans]